MSPWPGNPPLPGLVPLPRASAELYSAARARQGALVHPCYPLLKAVPWHDGWSFNAPRGADRRSPGVKVAAYQDGAQAMGSRERRHLMDQVLRRRAGWIAPLERGGLARRLVLRAKSDVVVWFVSAGPLELGLAVHHTYGVPFLPGTSLKGLARAHSDHEDTTYGTPDHVAKVSILDGIPLPGWEVQRDVMTPHFSSWYNDNAAAPNDTEDPTPIPFLSIAAGARFETAVVIRRLEWAGAIDEAVDDLRRGLEGRGLGAKTAAGYGVFTLDVTSPPDEGQQQAAARGPAMPPRAPNTGTVASPKGTVSGRSADVVKRLEALRALKAGAVGAIAPFVEWCLALPDGPDKMEAARAIVDKLGAREARRRAKGNQQLARIVEIAEAQP